MSALAVDTDQIKTIGIAAAVAFVVVGVLISFLITKIIAKVIVIVIFLALGGWVWQQRASIIDKVDACNLKPTFFGVRISLPEDVYKDCLAKQDELKK
jgi:hypothetical protein